jgi:hypothetical protein
VPPPAAGRSSMLPPALVRRPASSWRHARPSRLAVYGLTIPQAYSTRSGLHASAGNGAPTWPFAWKQMMSCPGAGERQKKGLVFPKVSARDPTTTALGRTRPLKLLTLTHWPPSLVVKRAELALVPMVKGGGATVPLPIVKLFTVKPATEKFAGTPDTAVRSISMLPPDSLSDMTKSGGLELVEHSYRRRPPCFWQHAAGRPQPPHEFGSGHICWAHAVPASRIVVTHTRSLIPICFLLRLPIQWTPGECRARAPGQLSPVGARRRLTSCCWRPRAP